MGVCHVCAGPTGYKMQRCDTCKLLCARCGKAPRRGSTNLCKQCTAKKNHNQYKKKSPEEIKRSRTRAAVNALIKRGKMQRTPCAECCGPGQFVHFPGVIEPKAAIFLCRKHHQMVRPWGARRDYQTRNKEGST